jgi:AmmeMemoRadiSam system protein B
MRAVVGRSSRCFTLRGKLGAAHARLLHYADSGDVSGDKSAVVGYMAAAVW